MAKQAARAQHETLRVSLCWCVFVCVCLSCLRVCACLVSSVSSNILGGCVWVCELLTLLICHDQKEKLKGRSSSSSLARDRNVEDTCALFPCLVSCVYCLLSTSLVSATRLV